MEPSAIYRGCQPIGGKPLLVFGWLWLASTKLLAQLSLKVSSFSTVRSEASRARATTGLFKVGIPRHGSPEE